MLFLDGVYVARPDGATRFRWVKAPTGQELTQLAHTIAHRIGRFLEQQGLLERDAENSYLTGETMDDDPLNQLLGSSITYRIAVGPQQGRKVFTLKTLPACDPEDQFGDTVGKVAGLLRASCPPPFGPAFGCSKSLPAILSACMLGWRPGLMNARSPRLCRYDVQGCTSIAGGRKP